MGDWGEVGDEVSGASPSFYAWEQTPLGLRNRKMGWGLWVEEAEKNLSSVSCVHYSRGHRQGG